MFRLSTREISYTAVFTALIALGAFIAIPLGPVPFTLQPMFVLLAGLVLGPRLGPLCVVAYLILGLVAPVYSGGTSGLGVLLGPTGGYLIGFVFGAMIAGAISHTGTAVASRYVIAALAGLLPIYVLGAMWLGFSLGTADPVAVLVGGVLQFLPFDVIKACVAGLLALTLVRSPLGLPSALRDR
jgi:biotin transport system substrate-specific component